MFIIQTSELYSVIKQYQPVSPVPPVVQPRTYIPADCCATEPHRWLSARTLPAAGMARANLHEDVMAAWDARQPLERQATPDVMEYEPII